MDRQKRTGSIFAETAMKRGMGMIRHMVEQNEKLLLSKYAVRSVNTKGREYPINPCDIRTEFQRDRDRIIHCKSFRAAEI